MIITRQRFSIRTSESPGNPLTEYKSFDKETKIPQYFVILMIFSTDSETSGFIEVTTF